MADLGDDGASCDNGTMKAAHQYTWKNDITFCSNQEVRFPIALQKDMTFVDLLNGKTYKVLSVQKAKENDRDNLQMPEDVVQTLSAGSLSVEELATLRAKYKFQPDEQLTPGGELAILDST